MAREACIKCHATQSLVGDKRGPAGKQGGGGGRARAVQAETDMPELRSDVATLLAGRSVTPSVSTVSGLGSGAARAPQPLPTAPGAGRNAASAPFEFALAFELRNQKLADAASPPLEH
jgi:hypothetical protein